MLQAIRKWFALRSYRKLGPKLRKRYGRQESYTSDQVTQTMATEGYDTTYLPYALSMYCSASEFSNYSQQSGESHDYDSLRSDFMDRFGDVAIDDTDRMDAGSSGSDCAGDDGPPGDSDSGGGGDSGGGDSGGGGGD